MKIFGDEMKLIGLILFLIQLIHTYGFSLYSPEDCADFTVGDCTITEDSIINQFATDDVHMCQEVCRELSSCILFSHDGITCSLLSEEYRKGCGDVGAPVDADVDICEDAIVHSCSGFDEENCEYFGESVGVDPPNGEVSDPLVCQKMCDTYSDLGCAFWVYKDKPKSCQLLKSSARSCTGISGPRSPPIEDCRPPKSCSAGTEFLGNCYEVVQTNAAWDAAAQDCSSRGGALAAIHNQDVNSYLAGLIVQRTWIGGNDKEKEGVWVWSNGEQMDFTNWGPGLPDDLDNEDCVEIGYTFPKDKWNDLKCTKSLHHYICQFPMTVLQ